MHFSRSVWLFLVVGASLLALSLAYLGIVTLPSNLTGWFLILVGVMYPLGMGVYLVRQHGQTRIRGEESNDLSFWLILPGFLVAIFGAPLENLYLPAWLPRTAWMQAIGNVLLLLSIGLYIWARRTIRKFYSGHLQIQTDHQLVQVGAYRLMRHPAYAGYLLMSLGVATGYSSLVGLAGLLFLLLPGMIYRMNVEERLLRKEFGALYDAYARRTRRLIPGIW